jgi:sugar phosphate permease
MTLFFAGAILSKFRSKNILTVSLVISSLSTICIPLARYIAVYDYIFVTVLRMLTGISQGFLYPASLSIILKWSPSTERVYLTSFLAAGSASGIMITSIIFHFICKLIGIWEINFYVIGSFGLISVTLWLVFGADSPHENRYISFQELTYIQETVEKTCDLKPIREWPLKEILTSKSVIFIIFTNILSDFAFYGIYSILPNFLKQRFNFNLITVGLFKNFNFIKIA